MEWKRGSEYSVMIHGAEEPQRLTYVFGASAGGRFLPELSELHVFVDRDGRQVEYQANEIVSVVSWFPKTEITVDLSDPRLSTTAPKAAGDTENQS
jgi:hypothetical protein